jgi:hypothetical protein
LVCAPAGAGSAAAIDNASAAVRRLRWLIAVLP